MKTILIVEDDKLLGKAVAETLEEGGFSIFWARNADETYEALNNQEINLVFLDIMLPEPDGYEILRTMKQDENHKKIPVVMLSNLGQMDEINKAMELGAKDYIIKANIDMSTLVDLTKKKYLSGV